MTRHTSPLMHKLRMCIQNFSSVHSTQCSSETVTDQQKRPTVLIGSAGTPHEGEGRRHGGGGRRGADGEGAPPQRDTRAMEGQGGERKNRILLRCIRRRMIENREIWLGVFLIVCGYSMRLVGDLSAHPLTQSSNTQTSLSNLFFFSVLLP